MKIVGVIQILLMVTFLTDPVVKIDIITSLRCNGSSNMIYLKDLKENERFIDIGPTMAKWPGG